VQSGILEVMGSRVAGSAFLVICLLLLLACGGTGAVRSTRAETSTSGARGGTAAASARGAAAAPEVRLVTVGRFDAPTWVTSPPSDRRRLIVVQQGGLVRVVRDGRILARPFLDVRDRVVAGGEEGLFCLVFAPDYARSGRFYVAYTDRRGGTFRVVEYRRTTRNRADPSSARTVLSAPGLEPNHNGGQLAFGPDGLLYVGTGDGGGANDQHGARGNAQNLGSLLGKILRVDPRPGGGRPYRIPSSNPFIGRPGARGEIYAYGLRNPWRFSFDRRTGGLAIGDVGQNAVEEIDFARRGGARGVNYGWRVFEGTHRVYPGERAPGARFPVLEHRHDAGFCSITGGYVVRDPRLPALAGRYVYGDFCDGRLRIARLRPGGAKGKRVLGPTVASLSSFGEDAAGRVYAVSLAGPVYRLAAR
jgi:glucose/arabinose dehydrogenase